KGEGSDAGSNSLSFSRLFPLRLCGQSFSLCALCARSVRSVLKDPVQPDNGDACVVKGRMVMIKDALRDIIEGGTLDRARARAVMEEIMTGGATGAQFGALV